MSQEQQNAQLARFRSNISASSTHQMLSLNTERALQWITRQFGISRTMAFIFVEQVHDQRERVLDKLLRDRQAVRNRRLYRSSIR